jgi:hypothetical protein
VVLVKESDSWRAYFCTAPNASPKAILAAVAARTSIEQTFKDVKEVEGAGEQQLRYWRANVGAFNGCLWGYTLVEWWAWDQPESVWGDRSASPWDEAERRPSHAQQRKALQRECWEREFWRRWGSRPCPPEIRAIVTWMLQQASGPGERGPPVPVTQLAGGPRAAKNENRGARRAPPPSGCAPNQLGLNKWF